MKKNYNYTILREEVEAADFFEDKTHEKISDSILKLICKEENGITIGLSGQWGSGKSTIINLLKKKKELLFFYFDAWAHEGDPLRRIFLESLINCLKESLSSDDLICKLEELRKKVGNEERIKKIEINRTTTLFGLLLSVSVFVLTIGVAILSNIDYDKITLELTGDVNGAFLSGIFLSLFPFYVLLGNLIYLLSSEKEVADTGNWSFIQSISSETVTEDISGDEERTSIEFERYFKQSIELFYQESNLKIVIVLDNLDRIDASDSLKIWSTLQTFIQHKNPTSNDYQIFKKIFTIIPYDEESLSKIWEKYTIDRKGNTVLDKDFSKSFFDKSFQVRIDVPKPILSNWLGFLRKMINANFEKWDEEDIDVIIDVIQVTRKNILDNPKPREIKNYLNQIGFLRNHFDDTFSTKSIAYYVYKRYLEGKSNEEIAREVAPDGFTTNRDLILENNFLNAENIIELAAITYGVTKAKGSEILLTTRIIKALTKIEGEGLITYETEFKDVFWSIFKSIIIKTNEFNNILKYLSAIYYSFPKDNSKIAKIFIPTFQKYLILEDNSNFEINDTFINNIESAACLLYNYEKPEAVKKIWVFYLKVITYQVDQRPGQPNEVNYILKSTLEVLVRIQKFTKIDFEQQTLEFDIDKWIIICKELQKSNFTGYLIPQQDVIDKTAENIHEGIKIESYVLEMINYYIDSNTPVGSLDIIVNELLKYFKWNGGNLSSAADVKAFELFSNFFFKYQTYDYGQFLNSYEFYAAIHFIDDNETQLIKDLSVLCAIYFKENVSGIILENSNSYSNNTLEKIKEFWVSRNSDNAQYAYEVLKVHKQLDLIWEIIKNPSNLLCCDIFDILVANEEYELFANENSIEKLVMLNKLRSSDFDIEPFIDLFIKHSGLENELLSIQNFDVVGECYIYYLIAKKTSNKEILKKIENSATMLDEHTIFNSLKNNDDLIYLLLQLKIKNSTFCMGTSYYEAVNQLVSSSMFGNNPTFDIMPFYVDNWDEIVNMMDKENLDHFSLVNSRLLLDEKDNLKKVFYDLNSPYLKIDYILKEVVKDIDNFKLYIEEVFRTTTDISKLLYISFIFKNDPNKSIKLGGIKEIIRDSLLVKYEDNPVEEEKSLIKLIAGRLGIKIPPKSDT